MDHNAKQTGAVITFKPGISKEEAQKIIRAIQSRLETVNVQEYNPEYGSPVFYVECVLGAPNGRN